MHTHTCTSSHKHTPTKTYSHAQIPIGPDTLSCPDSTLTHAHSHSATHTHLLTHIPAMGDKPSPWGPWPTVALQFLAASVSFSVCGQYVSVYTTGHLALPETNKIRHHKPGEVAFHFILHGLLQVGSQEKMPRAWPRLLPRTLPTWPWRTPREALLPASNPAPLPS